MAFDTRFRALIIEDDPNDALLLRKAIKKSGYDGEFHCVSSKEDLQQALTESWDFIFSDYSMPSFLGPEALAIVRAHDQDIPFFFISGTMGEANAVEAMRLGAQDYFVKGSFERLAPAIARELRDILNRREHRRAQKRIHYLANYDPLTGLPNRNLLVERLFTLSNENPAETGGFTVFNLNLDNFREIADNWGMAESDGLLVEIGKRLNTIRRTEDIVARLAADEFVYVACGLREEQATETAAQEILSIFRQPFKLARYEYMVTASLGSSSFPHDAREPELLLSNAAMALHTAKKIPGNSFLPYKTTMRETLHEKLLMDHALEQALSDNEFEVYYQPQVSLRSQQTVGLEALLRWNRPGAGAVNPQAFIPVAEQSGLIVPLGHWVLRDVCRQLAQWRQQGHTGIHVAINFSAHQFRDRDMPKLLRQALDDFRLPPSSLEVEITETALMQDPEATLTILSALRNIGVSIALDDFGTGYSSLSYLKRFPVDVLKIDREFVQGLPEDRENRAIVEAIIAMSDKLGVSVLAEGIEAADQCDFLRQAGCSMVQGFYFRPPEPAPVITTLL